MSNEDNNLPAKPPEIVFLDAAGPFINCWLDNQRAETEKHLAELQRWFSVPIPSGLLAGDQRFAGCIVYRNGQGRRCGLLATEGDRLLWDRGVRHTMGFCSQPDGSWSGAEPVGFATTYEEAAALLTGSA